MPVCLEATDLGFCQRRPMKRLGVRPQTLITVNLMQKSTFQTPSISLPGTSRPQEADDCPMRSTGDADLEPE